MDSPSRLSPILPVLFRNEFLKVCEFLSKPWFYFLRLGLGLAFILNRLLCTISSSQLCFLGILQMDFQVSLTNDDALLPHPIYKNKYFNFSQQSFL